MEALILGLIQGLTEFIPVSSSGHLVLAQTLFSGASDHLFLEWVNIGTFLALLVYFRRRIMEIVVDIVAHKKYRLARNILLTSIPAGIVGYLSADFIDQHAFFGSSVTVVVTLALVGIVMVVLEKLPKLSSLKLPEQLSSSRALTIGVAQMLALIPGVSRSGSTIVTGRLMGLSARQAAEYSFLASLPIMAGVTLKLFTSSSDMAYLTDNVSLVVVSNIAAFASGLVAVGFLMRYLSRHSLVAFGWYRIGLAAVMTVILLVQ